MSDDDTPYDFIDTERGRDLHEFMQGEQDAWARGDTNGDTPSGDDHGETCEPNPQQDREDAGLLYRVLNALFNRN